MPLQYVIDMHFYQSISLVQDMVIVDVMKPQSNYIMYLTDIILTIIIVNLCISNTTYIIARNREKLRETTRNYKKLRETTRNNLKRPN